MWQLNSEHSKSPLIRLRAWAERNPSRAALVFEGGSTSYAQLLEKTRKYAHALHHQGVRAGDTVALYLAPSPQDFPEQVAQLFGVAWLGASILPITPDIPAERIVQLSNRFNANWLVSPTPVHACTANHISFSGQGSDIHPAPCPPCDDAEAVFLYEFTSGTTGAAKTMRFTGAEYAQRVAMGSLLCNWQDTDRAMAAIPWPGKVGIRTAIRTLTLGATHVEAPFPTSIAQLRTLSQQFHLNDLTTSPWQLRQLLADIEATPDAPLLPMLNISTVGSVISAKDIAAIRQRLTPHFYACYGATEIGLVARIGPDQPANSPYRLHEGIEGGALDPDGVALPPGRAGRLRFRAPWFTQRYAQLAQMDGSEGFRDGWFVTSDSGTVCANGDLVLNGRLDDVINVGGAKVVPAEVEQTLLTHPAVAEAVVLAAPHPMAGEVAIAFVVLRKEVALATLTAHLHQHLDSWMVPADFIKLDHIPRNAGGKVDQQLLRKRYQATGRLG